MRHLIGRRYKSNLMKRRIHIWPWCNGAIKMHDDSHLNTIGGKWSWFRQHPFAKTEQIPLQRSSDLPIFMSGISMSSMWWSQWIATMTYSVGDDTNINSPYTDSKHLLLKSGASQIVAWFVFCMQYSSVDSFKVFTLNKYYVYTYVCVVSH